MESTKICPRCGKEVLDVARKCKHCGYWFKDEVSLAAGFRRCPVCDEIIPEDVKACPCCDEPIVEISLETQPLEAAVSTDSLDSDMDQIQNAGSASTENMPIEKKSPQKTVALFIGIGIALILVLLVVILYMALPDLHKQGDNGAIPAFPSERLTEEDMAIEVAREWNTLHQQLDADALASLYGDKVYYYHEYYTPEKIVQNKRELFRKYPEFWQEVSNMKCSILEDGRAKVAFSKEVKTTSTGKMTTYPSYLIMSKINGNWKITVESDEVTDANLAKKRSKVKH